MKTIVCFGDSLTWGYNPDDGTRYSFDQRWPGILQNELGNGVRVIEEALNGRLVFKESSFLPNRSGQKMIEPLLESHAPIDILILMLGTNDVQPHLNLSANEVASGCASLIWAVQRSMAGPGFGVPQILLIAPPLLGKVKGLMEPFFKGGEKTSRQLAPAYENISKSLGCHFLDSSKFIRASKIDGVHLDPSEHKRLALRVKKVVMSIFKANR